MLRFHPCVSVPAHKRLFSADDLRRRASLLKGATFLAPRSILAAAHGRSTHHFLTSRYLSGASGSMPAALSSRERRPGLPGFSLWKIQMTCSGESAYSFFLGGMFLYFLLSTTGCFLTRPVLRKDKKCKLKCKRTHQCTFFPSNNAPLLPVAAKAAQKKNQDVFNLVGPNLLLEEDTVRVR